jgi:hypothetical protein
MRRQADIVVFMEDLNLQPVAVRYAAALARRMRSRLLFLLLIDPCEHGAGDAQPVASGIGELESHCRSILEQGIRQLVDEKVSARVEVLLGDRRSEFLKYMAGGPAFHTAVWGGTERSLRHRSASGPQPWTACIARELPCPFVIPREKNRRRARTA